ncbi:hypothetical protein ENUP19_0259G0045 [Entamoeba nuttalli]|uniref:Rab GTPase activating protein, putative n=2 Tax=Entamoeba nuttalli TaxID=412467 RepID=K2H4W7_ENTNP|nr:Rab GTPase activating protein, putative [Entamoeba nuttalli P19]EKE37519.1 Rab GTPase activating protein, putative [Entamoeba nuttalli P19]|eukprot:XP_008860145.1 Rab GTPase activating protein, putative [Entamoeba nuttalli P19]
MKSQELPFQKRTEPKTDSSLFQYLSSFTTNVMNQLSSSFVPHFTYSGNPYVYNAVCDCLNELDYSRLEYQCNNGIPAELRAYVWYALLLRPSNPWEIKHLYSEKNGKEYKSLQSMLNTLVDNEQSLQEGVFQMSKIDQKTLRVIECDIIRTFPEGAEYLFKEPKIIEMLRRILQIYSIIHVDRGYFQGLNDIVGIIITAFMEPKQENGVFVVPKDEILFQVETTVYFSLEKIMDKLYINHSTQFHVDLLWTEFVDIVDRYYSLFSVDPKQPNLDIVRQQSYRWFVCLFCREFHFHLTLALWDNFMLDNGFRTFIIYFAFAVLINITRSCDSSDLEKFNKSTKEFYNKMTESNLSYLITSAYSYKGTIASLQSS